MWRLLLTSAYAGSSGEAVDAALVADPQAQVGIACAPMGTLLGALSKLPIPPTVLAELGPEVRDLQELFDPEAAAAAGVDRGGTFLFVGKDKETTLMSIPFAGTHDQADAMLRRLYPDVTASGQVWRYEEKGKARLATLEGSALRMQAIRTENDGPALTSVATLLAGLPAAPGCTVAVRGFDSEKADGAMALYVPLAGKAPLLARMKIDQFAAPPELLRGGPVPDLARTVEAPSLVITVGVSIDSILDAASKAADFPAADLQKLHGVVAFGPGASLATFGNPKDKRFAAVVPITAPDGSELRRGRVLRFITKASEGKVKRTGGGRFRGDLDGTEVFGAVDAGRVVLGSAPDLVDLVMADQGEAWLTSDMRTFTMDWPISVQTRGQGPMTIRSGVRAIPDGAWEASLEVTGGSPEMTAFAIGMISALAAPAFVEMSHKAAVANVKNEVEAIRVAQLAWLTDHDTALAMPAHPRPVEGLGKEATPWTAQAQWDQLGWSPESGETKGTYWVEITPDGKGFTVWGAVDADGDGMPAKFKATRDQPVAAETGEKVY